MIRFIQILEWLRRNPLPALMLLTSLFNAALVLVRMRFSDFDWSQIGSFNDLKHNRGIPTFLFLLWNLFLAWVPYLLSLTIQPAFERSRSWVISGSLFCLWLLFFPNAPYIVTDLLHLRDRSSIPHWYDVMLFFSFAWTGLTLGYLSLLEVRRFVLQQWGRAAAEIMALTTLALCGFGVYLGRVQRWNSWDILVAPKALLQDVLYSLTHPMAHAGTLGLAVVLTGFLILGYWVIRALVRE